MVNEKSLDVTGAYCSEVVQLLALLNHEALTTLAGALLGTRNSGSTVWVMGNGGSEANASHLVLHLQAASLRAHDLLDGLPSLTAFSNDKSYEALPLRQLRAMAHAGDILVVISGSGDSANVLVALAEAKRLGLNKLGLLGFGGGAAAGLCDHAIVLSSHEYGPIEDVHSVIVHLLDKFLAAPALPRAAQAHPLAPPAHPLAAPPRPTPTPARPGTQPNPPAPLRATPIKPPTLRPPSRRGA